MKEESDQIVNNEKWELVPRLAAPMATRNKFSTKDETPIIE